MENIIYHQNVICHDSVTDQNFSHDWYWPDPATACPSNDPNHTFLTTFIVGNVSEKNVIVINDTKTTNGGYHAQGYEFDVAAGPDADYLNVGNIVFPYDICLECASLVVNGDNYGDWVEASLIPPGPIGTLTTGVSSGNILHLNTCAYVKIGMTITLVQGLTTQNVGDIHAIDMTNLTITVSGSVSQVFTPGAYVTAVANYIKSIPINQMMKRTFGDTIEGNVFIPTNSTILIKYKNKTASAKNVGVMIEYFA